MHYLKKQSAQIHYVTKAEDKLEYCKSWKIVVVVLAVVVVVMVVVVVVVVAEVLVVVVVVDQYIHIQGLSYLP